ncbi:MAG: membrane dipeptidase [Paludibacteraceae bacterium]
MKPIIGISANYKDGTSRIADAYVQAVVKAGALPMLIPVTDDETTLAALVRHIDGLLLTGGGDIDPKYFQEDIIPECGAINATRDVYDLLLIKYACRYQTPILGICRGMQILNVYFGGNLYQDIYTQNNGKQLLHHDQNDTPRTEPTHNVTVEPNSKLYQITQHNALAVNTFHHQAVRDIAPTLRCAATATDGICEAIESPYYPILGVQWHPENLAIAGRNEHCALFAWLIGEAGIFKHAKELHQSCPTLDSHCDTPMVYTDGMDFGQRNDNALVDFVKMNEGRVDAIFMAAYIPQKELTEQDTAAATKLAFDTLQLIHKQVDNNRETAVVATSVDTIAKAKAEGKKAIVPVVENGYAIGNELENVQKFYDLGVRYITLCHNGDNSICDSAARSLHRNNGVSAFGRQVIAEMNKLGIMVDLSHAAEQSFWDALACSSTPIICSHSSARALCDHPRNLTDQQLKALANQGGVCQLCLYDGFLTNEEGTADVQTAVNHIEHIIRVAGIYAVGIGSDFDGGGGINGCRASNELINITKELIRRGHSDEDIRLILGGNLLRVMTQVEHNKNQHK